MTGDPQHRLAEQLLRLDGDLAAAHEVLGHELHKGVWGRPGGARRSQRRREIAVALAAARKLALPIVVGPSTEPMLTTALGRLGTSARLGDLELHTSFAAPKTERILRQALRAAAFLNFLRTGEVALPVYKPWKNVMFPRKQHYLDGVRSLATAGKIPPEQAAAASQTSSWGFGQLNLQICTFAMEGNAQVSCLTTLEYWRGNYPCLTAGRINFVCRTVLGQPIPSTAELVTKKVAASGGTRAVDAKAAAERERWLALAPAGMHGGRLWMRYLATCGEVPRWEATMREQVAMIQGDELLKATLMVDFLSEEGLFAGLEARAQESGKENQPAALAAALGADLPELDERFAAWVLGPRSGILQRLETPIVGVPPAAAKVVAAVQRLREQAGLSGATDGPGEPGAADRIEFDPELSDGCAAHARYLHEHREQTERWPDCHEQYADRDGWSAPGAMAGAASVISIGVRNDAQALDSWMGTFYHRLPLLQPGLRRIGYARDSDIAVLDSGSMVDPRIGELDTVVVWPFDGMTGTPTMFAAPEMPNPVPGENQANFGYPITMQCSARSSELPLDVRLVLREQIEQGREVPCWFSSPGAPSNPQLAPANAFCLIPKAPLKEGAVYWVQAEFVGEDKTMVWTFRT